MSDTDILTEDAPAPKKGKKKLFVLLGALIVLGGGTAGGLYAAGIVGGAHGEAHKDDGKPKLVPKSEQKRVGAGGEGGEGGKAEATGKSSPGAEKYASNYYTFEKDFTSNLGDSDRFVQVGFSPLNPPNRGTLK